MRGGGSHYPRGSGNPSGSGGQRGGYQTHSRSAHHGSADNRDNREKKKRDVIFDLNKYNNQMVRAEFIGGRKVTGILKGFDQLLNIVLDEAVEVIHDPDNPGVSNEKQRRIGLVVLRGPSIILVSPTDGSEEIENPFVQA
ncbi:U6 snRNA-associated Sm-like protein LSm7 [Coemansia reversa NRRL 1564]|uniref:U6 snRNA-associated Sm-like protein LSm7 n=1 Tax=Coemansia reversa (strain ATCC 12441 / NRRL 1564) TaxID=763665 RepID=A0A2G5B4S3_COERN|nr:U6 snRNA-associated Sm-like protein LSm7 [Coemansia reversa NRRL 1564]|eukprot:PIA14005.1 U6 snRNA-associated Sm-like protein LSm7 [Coemansia reversa NRRL 1564]